MSLRCEKKGGGINKWTIEKKQKVGEKNKMKKLKILSYSICDWYGQTEDIWMKNVYKDTRLKLWFKEGNIMLNKK